MDKKECSVCKKMTQEKHKFDFVWKLLAIIFICLSILFACLYFCNSKVIADKEITQENIVEGNDIDKNQQTNVIEFKDNSIMIGLIVGFVVLTGGILGGCYICKKKNNSTQHNSQ